MSDLSLMEDYFRILEQCQDPDETFKDSPEEKNFASAWLFKLCNEIYRGNNEKQTRNLYLLELSKCINNGQLSNNFMKIPPKGMLPPLESTPKIKIAPETIIGEMKVEAEETIPVVSQKNYQTHMSTKIFDDNRGACAYLAISLGDPKDGPIWTQMGSGEPFNQSKTKNKEYFEENHSSENEDCGEVNDDFIAFCLQVTAKELAGQAKPGDCPTLEEKLALYADFIQKYDIGNNASELSKSELRTFLLLNFQADLIHALETVR